MIEIGVAGGKENPQEAILREHVSLIPDEKDAFNDGIMLWVIPDQDDDLHIEEHNRFLKENGGTISIGARDRMKMHIKKHMLQREEKSKLMILSNPHSSIDELFIQAQEKVKGI